MLNKKYKAFVFARGGSKGVKNKNIREIGGKPLIAYSIESALKSEYINEVIVSTDCEKIASVAVKFGATVLERPIELAQDNSAEILAWKHAIESFENNLNGVFVSLPATSPLRNSEDINNALKTYLTSNFDIIFGITPSHRNPYLNMVKINSNDTISIVNSGLNAVRRQDVPQVYDVTTCVYVGNVNYIKSCATLMQGKVGHVVIPCQRSIDIDTEYDLHIADLIIKNPFNEVCNEK